LKASRSFLETKITPKPTKEKITLQSNKKKKELLFVNKKKQKNFDHFWPVALQRPWRRGAKVFWFLRPDDDAASWPGRLNRAA
jgi:hypothetical protein